MPDALDHVLVEHPEADIALVRLNRPERLNALTDAMLVDIDRRLAEIGAETATRVVVLTGAGRGFCAGFDLDHAASAPGEETIGAPRAWTKRQEALAGLVTRLRGLPSVHLRTSASRAWLNRRCPRICAARSAGVCCLHESGSAIAGRDRATIAAPRATTAGGSGHGQ